MADNYAYDLQNITEVIVYNYRSDRHHTRHVFKILITLTIAIDQILEIAKIIISKELKQVSPKSTSCPG